MTHECHAEGCERAVPPRLLMCAQHWRLLPSPAQRIIWHHYRVGQELDKKPSALYLLAQRTAVLLVAFIEGTWSARRALQELATASAAAQRRGLNLGDVEEMARAMGCERIVGAQ